MSYEKISQPLDIEFPNEWYELNLACHFWFAWRLLVLQRLMSDNAMPTQANLRALEIGCGNGYLRSQIEMISRWMVDGVDLNVPVLEKAGPSRGRTMLYNIEDRLETLKEQYDVIILFDVLEHISDPERFLTAALWHLKPGGSLLINVPAFQSLYSRYDQLVGHFRRYDTVSIRRLLESQVPRLEVKDIRYWGLSLIPVAWLRKLAVRSSATPQQAIGIGFDTPANWINLLFRVLMRIETYIVQHPPAGSSLMLLATKRAV